MSANPTQSSRGWHKAKLADLLTVIRGVSYKKEHASSEPSPDRVPILRATNIQNGLVFEDFVHVPRHYVSDEQLLRKNDIVIAASSGSRNIVGKAAQLTSDWFGSFGTFCFGLRPKPGVDPGYLAWFLQTSEYRHQVSELSAGVNINNLRASHIEQIPIPVAPLPEQRRIVAEIEKQFARLEAGVRALKRVQANLKRYRAAVLKAACEGRLVPTEAELTKKSGKKERIVTKDSKASSSFIPHPSSLYESGSELLTRILADRRKKWLAHRSLGKGGAGRGQYKEPVAPDTANLGLLPKGWTWARAEQLFEFITKGTTPSSDKMRSGAGDIPFIKVYNLTFSGALNLDYKPTFVSRETHENELARSDVRAGDILINIVGPPLGQVSIVPHEVKEANMNQAVSRFRVVLPETRKFLAYCLMTDQIITWATKRAKTTAGQSNITLELCRDLPIPLPPLAEQTRIVEEVERRLSVVEELEATVSANLQRATRLRQAVLQKAFSGGFL